MALFSMIDLFAYAIPGPLIAYFGPYCTQLASFIFAGFALMVCAALPVGSWQIIAAALLGRLGMDIAFTTIYILTVECFPVHSVGSNGNIKLLRSSRMPFCSYVFIASSIGVLSAPRLTQLARSSSNVRVTAHNEMFRG